MTSEQRDALARLLVTLRPGCTGWDYGACQQALIDAGDAFTRDPETLARVAVNVACDYSLKRPEMIAMTGEHWRNAGLTHSPEPPRQPAQCPRCHSVACPGGTDDQGVPVCADNPSANVAERAELLRLTLRDAKRTNEPEPAQ